MLSILSGILGFATSGLPSILSFFQQKSDQSHEREMARLQNEQQLAMAERGFQAQQRVEEIKLEETQAEAYAQERTSLYNFASKEQDGASQWIINLRASVRPMVAFIFVGLLVFTDVAGFVWAVCKGADFASSMNIIFSEDEMAIVSSIIGFYFGSRHWQK